MDGLVWKLNHVFFLNRPDRPDRRKYMEDMLGKLGLMYTRVEAVTLEEPTFQFCNRRVRSNWISHESMIAKAIELNRPVVILEDDVIIHDFEKMKQHVRDVQQLEWDILYFYWGRDCLPRVAGARDSHAYMVNHKSAARLLGLLQARRAQLEQKGSKTVISYFDQALSKLTYEDIFARGSTDIICQNRARFGSDTGWGHKGTPKLLED